MVTLVGEEGWNRPTITSEVGIGFGHSTCLTNTDSVHHLKRTTCPAKAYLCSSVNVLHAADVFIHNLGRNTEHNAEQSFGNDRVLLIGIPSILGDIPLLVSLNQRSQISGTGVARRMELFSKVIGGMKRDGWPGEVHQPERPQTDSERLAGNGVDLSSVGHALFEEQTGLVEPRHKEAVHDEAWTIGTHDDHFSEHLAILDDLVDGLLAGGFGGNNLDEAILCGVVKEVQAHKAVSTSGGFSQRIHGK